MRRKFMRKSTRCLILVVGSFFCLCSVQAVAQGQLQLTIGDSDAEFQFVGNGSGTNTINVQIPSQSFSFTNSGGTTTTCSGGGSWFFAAGSASGTGSFGSEGAISCNSGYFITSSVANPLVLNPTGGGNFSVSGSTANSGGLLSFLYQSDGSFGFAAGTILLQGTLQLKTVTMTGCSAPNNCAATGFGALNVTGGALASGCNSNTALVTLILPLGGDLNSLIGTNGSINAQVGGNINTTCDFLTGGGWIPNTTATGTPNTALAANAGAGNGKGTFAIEGGCKHCQGWGHLNYIDHGTGMHVVGDADPSCPIAYSVVSNGAPNSNGQPTGCRRMRGSAKVNGQSGYRYDVTACDRGEPGTSDTFDVTVTGFSGTYHNSGTLGGGTQGGGNIQLHKGNSSFCCSTQ